MTTLQYTCTAENGKITHEEGHFFKAGAFVVFVEQNQYNINFEPKDQDTVVYRITHNSAVITELGHPDYVPQDCSFDDLNSHLNSPDAQAIFAALCHCGVSIEKDYLKTLENAEINTFSYKIEQAKFL